MELKISCDASVKLKKINSIKTIDCNVIDFKIVKDTLNGNIKINGTYIKDVIEEEHQFSEIVPFTVVFRDENFVVSDIVCGNFSCQEIVNQGIECHFDVFITYEKKDELLDSKPIAKKEKEVAKKIETIENKVEEKVQEIEGPEVVEPIKVVSDADISKQYDEMLQELLDKRTDNFLDEEEVIAENHEDRDLEIEIEKEITIKQYGEIEIEKEIEIEQKVAPKAVNVTIAKNMKTEKADAISKNMKESYKNITVYYLNKESEVDKVCKDENISIDDIYEDFTKHKRIIVK
jgi:hypothetical protein